MGTIILLMSMDEVETYGHERIREVIEMAEEEDMEVEVFEDTGRVVVTGGNARAEDLQYQLAHKLGDKLGVRVSIVSETEAPPKFEFSSEEEEGEDDDDEEEEDTYAQMASLSLYSMDQSATAIPESSSWQDQPVADLSRHFCHLFDYVPSYSED